jgi:hypothetical protein
VSARARLRLPPLSGCAGLARAAGGALAAAFLAAAVLSSCTSARNELGTSNGPCYVALPEASAAVHGQGHLSGVRLVWSDSLRRTSDVYRDALVGRVRTRQRFCVVEYSGHFERSGVLHPVGQRRGHVAIVIVSYPRPEVVVTILVHSPPNRFGHPHVA